MSRLIAVGHIGGSILALVILGFVLLILLAWESERSKKHLLEEAAAKLGVSVDDLNREELTTRLVQLSAERSSDELLRNRLSDLCGVIRTLWDWGGLLLQAVVIGAALWFTITESAGNAVYAWFAVGVAILFWLASAAFSLTCRLLTGRYPGEAKVARKALAEFLKNRHVRPSLEGC